MADQMFLAVGYLYLNGTPGGDPALVVAPGEVFSLDGSEGIHILTMLRSGLAKRWDKGVPPTQKGWEANTRGGRE